MSPKKIILFALLLLAVLGLIKAYRLWQDRFGVPEDKNLVTEEDHFKYGSVGSDNLTRGLPYLIWKVLPEMFPNYLPKTGKGGYEAFGLIVEPESHMDRPIGFSKRRIWNYIDFVGPNCAFCHVRPFGVRRESRPENLSWECRQTR